jgi:hypothetical protein
LLLHVSLPNGPVASFFALEVPKSAGISANQFFLVMTTSNPTELQDKISTRPPQNSYFAPPEENPWYSVPRQGIGVWLVMRLA